jgi:hypothetical protein
MHIKNIMRDLGYDKKNNYYADDDLADYRTRARQLLIDSTRKNLEDNLKKAELNKHDVFIVSNNVIFSLVTAKEPKKTVVDEAHLLESFLRTAHARRYGPGSQASANHSTLVRVEDNVVRS